MDSIVVFGGVRGYEKDGVAYLHIEDVARGLGFTQTQTKNGVEYTSVRWERVEAFLDELNFPPQVGEKGSPHDYYIPENIFYRLCMKAKNEVAEAFQAKVADEIIPSIRKNGVYGTDSFIERTLQDPDWCISVLMNLKFEREQRKLAEAQRDEAVRTKYHFVEGRDAKVCGENGGLHTQNEKLRAQIGDSKNWKQVKAIPWLRDIFVDCAGTYSQVGKALTKICRENDLEIRKTESSDNQPFNVYPIKAVNLLKKRLDADKNMLNKWRKQEA